VTISKKENLFMSSTEPVYVSLEFTPNPNTLKYSVNRILCPQGSVSYTLESKKGIESLSPLSAELLAIEGISAVMLGRDFATVTKTEEAEWDQVHKSASDILQKFLESGKPAVMTEALGDESKDEGISGIAQDIKKVIDTEVRPAVARDGGDIQFNRYEEGVVYVSLSGACAGCPSSQATLKMGIENRLREMFPEVQEVVSV